jgi:glyoxylase-like metal-dependent hydrolase (beta-lactamase superfamily II)/ferredoxin
MANRARRLAENASGAFFVDDTCIDCDTCRQIAPETFRDHGGQSSVYRQPAGGTEAMRALMALVACPTGSIGTGPPFDPRVGIEAFPVRLDENLYFCGFTSESSFGAWSYLLVRPEDEGGNVLIDSPRFNRRLARRIRDLGGLGTIFLTHRDDIADHERFAREFGARRVMHAAEGAARLGVEQVLDGEESVRLDADLVVVPTPGHTRGHCVLLYRDRYLFTGDHLAWSPQRQTLTAFRDVCWHSWGQQTRSMERLLDYCFEWVLPGHGRIHRDTPEAMRGHLLVCLEWMKAVR